MGRATPRASVTIKVADADALPAVEMMVTDKAGKAIDPPPTSVTEGDTIYVVVMPVDKGGDAEDAAEDLTVMLRPAGTADSADYEVVRTIDIDAGEDASAAVELEVKTNDDIGMESLHVRRRGVR